MQPSWAQSLAHWWERQGDGGFAFDGVAVDESRLIPPLADCIGDFICSLTLQQQKFAGANHVLNVDVPSLAWEIVTILDRKAYDTAVFSNDRVELNGTARIILGLLGCCGQRRLNLFDQA